MDSGYLQEQLGCGRVRFTVIPAPLHGTWGMPLGLAALFMVVVLVPGPPLSTAPWLLIRLAIAGCGGWWVHTQVRSWLARRVDRRRLPGGTFVVSAGRIEAANGTHIGRDQLRRLIVRNGVSDIRPTVVPAGAIYPGVEAGARNGRVANGTSIATISYMLCAEYDGESTTLAGGMNEVTAHGLLTDVSRMLSVG
jgi:hypothetical protein